MEQSSHFVFNESASDCSTRCAGITPFEMAGITAPSNVRFVLTALGEIVQAGLLVIS
jgi:hypothetical protein